HAVHPRFDRALGDLDLLVDQWLFTRIPDRVAVQADLRAAQDEVGRALPPDRRADLRRVDAFLDQLGAGARAKQRVPQPIVLGAQLGDVGGRGTRGRGGRGLGVGVLVARGGR